ncbi:glycosyltransferase [Frondihabitans cladoniiphilus]|uniref:Glycosyl transferase family 1 domain-containing protein n=1 Tax=Frondihabitans cladoniiphilus TaxID=715785 RepID=A0ABP8W3V9_9MICO
MRLLVRRLQGAQNEARDLRRAGVPSSGPHTGSEGEIHALRVRIAELESSTSWRVTRYLRDAKEVGIRAAPTVRRLTRRIGSSTPPPQPRPAPAPPHAEALPAFHFISREIDDLLLDSRLTTVLATLGTPLVGASQTDPLPAEARLLAEPPTDRSSWWLVFVGYLGSLPTDSQLDLVLADAAAGQTERAIARLRAWRGQRTGQWQVATPLRIIGTPVVDVTHTASTPLHTGVQRVVRNVVPLWGSRATVLVLDEAARAYRVPTAAELGRVVEWDDSAMGNPVAPAGAGELPTEVVVPWNTTVIVPELKLPGDLEILRCVGHSSTNTLAAIVYDTIPTAASEFVPRQTTADFAVYTSMIKHSGRVSAISESAGAEFRGLNLGFASQGFSGPVVEAHLLPIVPPPAAPPSTAATIAHLRKRPELPLVLQVGSIGPHKNQRATLSAAAAIWSAGIEFEVVFVAPNAWHQGDFAELVERQSELGRAVSTLNNVSEAELWSLYREAHVVVLPSFVEGYGLPIAEALSVGTPVITSGFGSMAEVARTGGALLIAPGDVSTVTAALTTMLTDADEYARLKSEADGTPLSSWQAYAEATWNWLARGEHV